MHTGTFISLMTYMDTTDVEEKETQDVEKNSFSIRLWE